MVFAPDAKYFHLSRLLLEHAFDEDGRQRTPLYVRLVGDVTELKTLIAPFAWHITEGEAPGENLYSLIAINADITI